MEMALNLAWVAIAAAAFLFVPRRSVRVSLAIAIVLAILFPIISPTDDVNAIPTFTDATATLVVAIVLSVALVAIARLGSLPAAVYTVHLATPSDPRSPPAR